MSYEDQIKILRLLGGIGRNVNELDRFDNFKQAYTDQIREYVLQIEKIIHEQNGDT